ncbi:MAG: hydroxymethylglutaryl-CoA reductase, degradative [Myxococcales bacterium]|nr:hydroxymethylglutaryl-CoA reductase, degradative [Myxococcales bacterium]
MPSKPQSPGTQSLWSGFYKQRVEDRRAATETRLGMEEGAIEGALAHGGLELSVADKTVENVIGTYALPFALGLHLQINGRDRVAPMVVEEPSVVAAASNAAKMIRAGGGFEAETDPPWMISQIALDNVPDAAAARAAIDGAKAELLAMADQAVPGLVSRGGGARELEVRDLGDGMMVVHVLVDCCDAMGANLVNTVAERIAPRVAGLAGGVVALRILSNLADRRCVRVRARVPARALGFDGFSGEKVRDGIVRASRFAERDPYRAATHNKGIMNGVDAVVMATGNDWRASEAGAHAYAARNGTYAPLCTWRVDDATGDLVGELEMPLALGTVGGPARVHRGVQVALELGEVSSAQDLAILAASVGVASNLAALRALSTVGIQEGHMALHARSVAIAAGARGDHVEQVARAIHESGAVTVEAAREVLRALTGRSDGTPPLGVPAET